MTFQKIDFGTKTSHWNRILCSWNKIKEVLNEKNQSQKYNKNKTKSQNTIIKNNIVSKDNIIQKEN